MGRDSVRRFDKKPRRCRNNWQESYALWKMRKKKWCMVRLKGFAFCFCWVAAARMGGKRKDMLDD